MQIQKINLEYEVYESSDELLADDKELLDRARQATGLAHAPYSKFKVGAAARLESGELVLGSNQENASFPAGICAERVLLSTLSSVYPGKAIQSMAISYTSDGQACNHPIAPCGICRQSLSEFETQMRKPIRLIMGGKQGKIFIINQSATLLPLAFTSDELK